MEQPAPEAKRSLELPTPYVHTETDGLVHLLPGQFLLPEFAMLQHMKLQLFETVPGIQVNINLTESEAVGTVLTLNDNVVPIEETLNFISDIFTDDRIKQLRSKLLKPSYDLTFQGVVFGGRFSDSTYSQEPSFLVYDVAVNGELLPVVPMLEYLEHHGLGHVPILAQGDIKAAAKICMEPPVSLFGNFPIRGVTLRPEIDLFTRIGRRILMQLSVKDFEPEIVRDAMHEVLGHVPTINFALGNPTVKVGELRFEYDEDAEDYVMEFEGNMGDSAESLFKQACAAFREASPSKQGAVNATNIINDWIGGPTPLSARDTKWFASLLMSVARAITGSDYDDWVNRVKNWEEVERAAGAERPPGRSEQPLVH